jgi:S-adenosyl methyltransferase
VAQSRPGEPVRRGLELVDPGLVSVERWRPEGAAAGDPGRTIPFYGAVARKP